jgi:peptidoglycan/xylan/chitin deacetylase (PgdA/CDA1 family)
MAGPRLSAVPPARRRSETLVLCYHAVSADWPDALAVAPDVLEGQVRGLLRRGFRATTFDDAATGPADRGKTLAVTFDDAYRSVVKLAFPILARLGVPATVFAPTAVGRDGTVQSWPGIDHWLGTQWESELTGASWDELRELVYAGWEIGSHTRSHPHLGDLDAAALADELEGSRADCERNTGAPCTTVAYPFGEVDGRVADATRRAGYAAAATLSQPLPISRARPDPMRWPRLGLYRGDEAARLRLKMWLFRRSPRGWNLQLATRGNAAAGGQPKPR